MYDKGPARAVLGPNGNPGSPVSIAGLPRTHADTIKLIVPSTPTRNSVRRFERITVLTKQIGIVTQAMCRRLGEARSAKTRDGGGCCILCVVLG